MGKKTLGRIDILADGNMKSIAKAIETELKKLGIKVKINSRKRRIRLATDLPMLPMAKAIKAQLKKLGMTVQIVLVKYKRFNGKEVKPIILGNVRNTSVFYLANMNGDPNDVLVKKSLAHQALYLADAKRITTIELYMPYMRQDRKDEPRTAISAKWVLGLINSSRRVKRLITTDIHSEQLLSNLDIPHDHLPGEVLFAPWIGQYIKKNLDGKYKDVVIVAPDEGSFKRAGKLAKRIHPEVGVAMFNKDRKGSEVDLDNIIGADVKGKVCFLNDDMMDTCGTIIKAAHALMAMGARKVILTATHAVFSPTFKTLEKDGTTGWNSGRKKGEWELDENADPVIDSTAYDKLGASGIEVAVSDSLFTEKHEWLTVLSWSECLAHVIFQNTQDKGGSVSKLIRNGLPAAKAA